jgi:hypothetical protein
MLIPVYARWWACPGGDCDWWHLQIGTGFLLYDPSGESKPRGCSLNLFVTQNPLLSGKSQRSFQQGFSIELNRIFGDAGVGINFVQSPNNADFTVSLSVAQVGPNAIFGTDLLGQAFPENVAAVYLGNLLAEQPTAMAAQLGTAAGEVAAHEIGHELYPGQDHPSNPDPSNIMKAAGDPFDERLWFTPGNEADIRAKCLARHPNP